MVRTTIASLIVVSLFALPFVGLGLAFVAMFSMAAAASGQWTGYLAVAFSSIFVFVGFGLVGASLFSYKLSQHRDQLMIDHPDSPWLWQDDWAAGVARGASRSANVAGWVIALFVDVFTIGAAAAVLPQVTQQEKTGALFVLILPCLGFFLTYRAALATARAHRFGYTWFAFTPGTIFTGSSARGTIHMKLGVEIPNGIDLALQCVRRITTGSGKNRNTTESILWNHEWNVNSASIQRWNEEALVPVECAIPADAFESNDSNSDDRVLWRLKARANVPGADFSDAYEIPVFRSKDAPERAMSATAGAGASPVVMTATGSLPDVAPEEVKAPAGTQIEIGQDEFGTYLYFRPFRRPAQAALLAVFTLIWGGVTYLLFTRPDAPWLFRIVFGGSLLLIGYGLARALVGSTRLRVGNEALSIRKALAGVTTSIRTLSLSDIESIGILGSGQTQAPDAANFAIRVKSKAGKIYNVEAYTLTRDEALWAADVVQEAMGKHERLKVEYALPMGRSATPPQTRPAPPPSTAVKHVAGAPHLPGPKASGTVGVCAVIAFISIWLAIGVGWYLRTTGTVHVVPSRNGKGYTFARGPE